MNVTDRFLTQVNEKKNRLLLLIKYTVLPVAAALLILAVSLLVDAIGVGGTIRLEAGQPLPSAASVSGHSDARYQYDDNEIDITKVGEYKIAIAYGRNNVMHVKVKVSDTSAPMGAIKSLSLHNGSSVMPSAEDFFEEIYDASDYEASFVNVPTLNGLGEYDINILLKDFYGNEKTYTTKLYVINDTEAPTISLPSQIVGYVGEGIAYRNGVTVSDNCFGATFEVDDSKVDTKKGGNYTVTYIVTDAAGNRVQAIIPVVIHEMRVTAEKLNEEIEKIAKNQGMSKSLSKEELCQRIYKYVNDPEASASGARFQYVGFSNDPSRTDWRNEAYLSLKNGQGDCYSYYALSKAFFEYFGIENLDIERKSGLTSDTHFWNMVNIGTTANPRWYFFDATRYAGKFTVGGDNGCLLTLAQLEGYKASNSKYDGVYYAFEEGNYPTAETQIINDKYSFK